MTKLEEAKALRADYQRELEESGGRFVAIHWWESDQEILDWLISEVESLQETLDWITKGASDER